MPIDEYVSSSKKWDWITPDNWFNFLDELFGFTLDVAADEHNTKCNIWISPEQNALAPENTWGTKNRWFLNPPWGNDYTKETGKNLNDWLSRCFVEYGLGNEGVCLVPTNCDTRWWHNHVKYVPYVFFPKGRIAYIDPERDKPSQPTKGTAIWIYVKKLTPEQISKLQSKGWLVSLVKTPLEIKESERPRAGGFKGVGVAS